MKNSSPLRAAVQATQLFDSGAPKVVVFDCDGVLFDSREANVRFYNHILARLGRPEVRPDQEDYIHMHSARESLAYLLGSGPLLDEAWRHCQSIDFRIFNRYLRKEPGLEEFLAFLRPHCRIALATNRTVSTPQILESFGLRAYFDLVVTAADVNHPKPHPESMEKILRSFQSPARHVLFIGDSQVDAMLAQNSGVIFVAYKNPELQAHVHADSFRDLQYWLAPALGAR
ncbi:haloacid dehalogenase superfamily, subfamily IA, variant 3 with third motif having DD or ED/haloacid dehalogenase superfamily, subfamily IA, variant 1 with third motif having Dx(3-4)D or Dx(3-4)E [Desulfacinum hydrothermale DSM 13146]|uniref:phosphoglycolate phosphatase n=1 Tax=Desulfacinum hydrothermale DSM 13146 TaxID=1121390 RepID=A0A1W1XI07_9BACT|nr:HAD family hydrolase [Desulfacinum hydrothermale]SMC23138.1 haloacid dehalogenase superfamily, subfamily IA, variant 3 with third motif having DD or ED/haloacid dehalogenase superfamily, subfamily IA, variant 1 with third motif having Dx(3-4)D or Dx(3-4)E [Desulfacinum hydrothermale DSM 13146]